MHSLPALPQEFISAALNRSLLEKKDLLMSAFSKFDADGDGKISLSELRTVSTEMLQPAGWCMPARHACMVKIVPGSACL